jgi:hypothetical protein
LRAAASLATVDGLEGLSIGHLAAAIGMSKSGLYQIVMCEANSDTAFGYHNFFTTTAAHKCYYAVVPGLDDTCLTGVVPI